MSVLGNSTSNSSNWTRAQIYSAMMQDSIQPVLLNDDFLVNVSDFTDGTTYNIPTVGDVTIRDRVEGQASQYEAIDDGNVTLTINKFKEAANSLTLEQLEDSKYAELVRSKMASKQVNGLMRAYLSDVLSTHDEQTSANANAVNGVDHRYVAQNSDDHVSIDDIAYAGYALQMADIPQEGRIGIVHPRVLLDIQRSSNLSNLINNPDFTGVVRDGFQKDAMMSMYDIAGFKILTSYYLDTVASETITHEGSSDTVTNGVANLFMSIASDDYKPFMRAWRRMPKVGAEYDFDTDQFKFKCTGRWGCGLLLPQGLVTVLGAIV